MNKIAFRPNKKNWKTLQNQWIDIRYGKCSEKYPDRCPCCNSPSKNGLIVPKIDCKNKCKESLSLQSLLF